jgi:hypothetical protein
MNKVKVSIEPYFEAEVPNMGLEKYGMVTFPDTEVREFVSQDINGRYITGIDPDAPAITNIEDDEEREAKLKQIQEIKSRLERVFGKDNLDARNGNFWNNFELVVHNNKKELDLKMPKDELLYHAVKAGGFELVAPDYDTARTSPKEFKYYMRKEDEDADIKIRFTILINEAKSKLNEMYHTDPALMFRIAKVILPSSTSFKPTTAPGLIYQKLNDFIEGKVVKTTKRETATQFISACSTDRETLTITGLVQDAIYYSIIVQEKDGHFYNRETEARYGKTVKEIVAFLKNPINSSDLENITKRVETKWRN